MSETIAQSSFYCTASSSFSDFAFQVQMKIVQGNCGGVTFRESSSNGAMYTFLVCQDGTYLLELYQSNTNSNILLNDTSDSINQGLDQTNNIAVVANGTSISLYVNGDKIDFTDDFAYSNGKVGLMVRDINNSTEVVFTNAQVWTL